MSHSDVHSPTQTLLSGIGRQVRTRRESRGLTRKALAAASGLSERFVADVELGKANASVVSLSQLASALQTELVSLLAPEAAPGQVVSLLGLRGAGKSALGQALAD